MQLCVSRVGKILVQIACLVPFSIAGAGLGLAQGIPATEPVEHTGERNLYLEVFVNGASSGKIAAFVQRRDGTLAIASEQLRNVGLHPTATAGSPDGLIDVSRLPDVTFQYDETRQTISFTAPFEALSTHVINAGEARHGAEAVQATSSPGALLNYTLFASAGGDADDIWDHESASAWLEARIFGPYGTLSSGFVGTTSSANRHKLTRLATTWSYSRPDNMTTISLGDIRSRGLSWTRPVRLGGIQLRRNFGLRPDLITMPLPDFSGSAALPSTVDVYVGNTRRVSGEIPAGPFQITDLPTISGRGEARVVVRDALGRETVVEAPFFSSSQLLARGLWDYSVEAGFARRFFGVSSDDYDRRLMASGTVRGGLTDRVTIEAHAEGGDDLINGGAGSAFLLGSRGVVGLAGAASHYRGRTGFLIAGNLELDLGSARLSARVQRSFGTYSDIASATAVRDPTEEHLWSAAPPRALDQVSLSVPLRFDPAVLNFSFTNIETVEDDRSRILSFSVNRPVGKRTSLYASAFTDLEDDDSLGLFAGLAVTLGGGIHASSGLTSDSDGTSFRTELIKSEENEHGSIGWRIRDVEGARTERRASVSYRAPYARVQAGIEQNEDAFRATGQMDGAIVFTEQELFVSQRIDDAFAVVDAGAPGVGIFYENRPMGRSNRRGKFLVTGLRSYEVNNISIDAAELPIDATVGKTHAVAIPASQSGTLVSFDVETEARAALVILKDEQNDPLQPGAIARLEGGTQEFVVGYDGQAFISGLERDNRIMVDLPPFDRCMAEFTFTPHPGTLTKIDNVVCRKLQ